MVLPILSAPVVVVCLAIVAALKNGKKTITAEQMVAFETAMHKCKDPKRLEEIADAFDKQGFKDPYGDMLRKRAKLRNLPREVKEARRKTFHDAMSVTDPQYVPILEKMADACHEEGCTGMEARLRELITGLKGQPNAPEHVEVADKKVEPPKKEAAPAPAPEPLKEKSEKVEIPEVVAELVQ